MRESRETGIEVCGIAHFIQSHIYYMLLFEPSDLVFTFSFLLWSCISVSVVVQIPDI
jgi:hypothetical protein